MAAQQRSFLPDTQPAPASSRAGVVLPKLSAKSLSRFSIVFGVLGAVAFLQNAGVGSHNSARNENEGRSLTLEEHEVEVTKISERVLQVAVNGIAEGYYTEKPGSGTCQDAHNPARGYDYTRFYEVSAEKCAKRCSGSLLLNEHRGFNYAESTKDCCCLFDDALIPLTERRKASEFYVENEGLGPVFAVDGTKDAYKCYVKEATSLGNPLDSYELKPCFDTGTTDVVEFAAPTVDRCAEKCLRFKLFATHKGFTHDVDRCECLFQWGEAPSVRKLSGSGASRKGGRSYSERLADMGDEGETAACYSKTQLQDDAGDRVPEDSTQRVWINEFHYRNPGENQPFVEIIGPKGQIASDYDLLVYQGRNGALHNTIPLSGTFDGTDSVWGFVVVDLTSPDIRKGKQGGDGLALAHRPDNKCVQLLSYTDVAGVDRSFKAKEGICSGWTAQPIGVFEERGTPLGHSLQMVGNGNSPSAFTWGPPAPATKGEVNVGQTMMTI